MADQRGGLGLGPTIIPGCRSGDDRQAEGVAELHEAAALSAASLSIAPARCIGLFAMIPSGRPSMRASAVTIARPKSARRKVTEPRRRAGRPRVHVVGAAAALGTSSRSAVLVGSLEVLDGPWK